MSFLDRIPFQPVITMAILLALLPIVPEPHLWQKAKMFMAGELNQLIDIGDVLFHSAPLLLLIAMLLRKSRNQS